MQYMKRVAENWRQEYNILRVGGWKMKSFNEQYKQAEEIAKAQTNSQQEALNAEELTKKIAASYNGKSSATMLKNILVEAEKSKRAGTLSNEEIERFYQSFAPMLDGFQRRALRNVVEKLKEI